MDELEIINDALVNTGNATVTLNDGTPEWQVASRAFSRAVDDLISQHGWPFARTSADLVLVGTNPSEKYDYAHQLPASCLLLKSVFVNGYKTEKFEVYGRVVCLDQNSGVSAEFIAAPADTAWHPQAIEVLTMMVEVACYRGLNEDPDEARLRQGDVELKLARVRSLIDQENPGRNVWRGTATEARQRRRG